MTNEQIEIEMGRFEKHMGIFFSYSKQINEFGFLDYSVFSTKLVFTGWLAAKQDAAEQRSEVL